MFTTNKALINLQIQCKKFMKWAWKIKTPDKDLMQDFCFQQISKFPRNIIILFIWIKNP